MMAPYLPACGPVARLEKYFQESPPHCLVQKCVLNYNALTNIQTASKRQVRLLQLKNKDANEKNVSYRKFAIFS